LTPRDSGRKINGGLIDTQPQVSFEEQSMTRKIFLIAGILLFASLFASPRLFAQQNKPVTPELQNEMDELVKQLYHDDFDVREAATNKLISIGKPAVPTLIKALESTDPEVRVRSVHVLKKIGEWKVCPELVSEKVDEFTSVLKSPDSYWYWSSEYYDDPYETPTWTNIRPGSPGPSTLAKDLAGVPQATEALCEMLGSASQDGVRPDDLHKKCLFWLGALGDPKCLDSVRKFINPQNPDITALVYHAIGQIGDPSCLQEIQAALKAADAPVRVAACITLNKLRDASSVPLLVQALTDETPQVRFNAFFTLSRMTGQKFGFNAWASEADRKAAIAKYTQWWDKNKASFKPAPYKKK
jgi:hypothetical protein